MTATTKLFELGQLAEASYADFTVASVNGTINPDTMSKALDNSSLFSLSQANEFAAHWQVASHQPDTSNGFSATLFQRIDDDPISGYISGQYVYAIRGTMGSDDLFVADGGDIVMDGLAIDQIIDLYNDWQRINTGKDKTYQAAKLVTLTDETALRLTMIGSPVLLVAYDILMASKGYIIDSPSGRVRQVEFDHSDLVFGADDPRAKGDVDINSALVDVTGHSLGGHLAAAFTRLFGGNAEALTINGAGYATGFFPGLSLNAGGNIANLFEKLSGSAQFDPNAINNLYAEANPEFITMDSELGLVQQGHTDGVFVEQSQPWQQTFGHGSGQMTDSLAVYDLFIRLDSGLLVATPGPVLEKLKPLFEAASNQASSSLENLVNALVDLYDTGIKIADLATDNREALYQAMNVIKDSDSYQSANGLTDVVLINDVGASQCVEKAKQTDAEGIAFRYALLHLNPFVLVDADYSRHNGNGELDLYDAKTGHGQITEQWLNDRAQMLSHLLQRNLDDASFASAISADQIFEDYTLPGVIDGTHLILTGPETLGENSHHIIFGDDQANQLQGGNLGDHLYGASGDDLLTGGKGNDYLEGGSGSDLYAFIAGDGMDTILDTDGLGKITLNGVQIKGQTDVAANQWIQAGQTWQDRQHHIGYNLVTQADGTQDLLIATADNTLIVKNWHADVLGITLESVTPPEPEIILTVTGDFKPLDQDPNTDGIQLGYDALGNVITDPEQPDPDHEDSLYDSTDNDKLQGFGGDDILDAIRGGDDLLEGGAGSDVLNGGSGNDFLYADVEISVADALAQADTQAATDQRGDWLYGGDDDDTLLGDGGNDMLLGGSGADLLIGGGGDDNLFGDKTGNANLDWDVFRSTINSNNDSTYTLTYFRSTAYDNPVGGDDILYGGEGNDWLIGNRGNDILDGGVGNDVLFGGEDKDFLLGGDGNDELYGNAGVSSPLEDGDDYLDGGTGNDKLVGGGGNDNLFGGLGDDVLYGDHNGTLEADEGEDYLVGGDGSDTLIGGGKNDILLGGAGIDYLFGEAGDDIMQGGADADELSGGAGMDYLDGGDGNDIIDGGEGNDTLLGGAGADILQGGADDDVYLDVTAEDTINDILGHSIIHLSQASGLAADNALSKVDQNGVDLAITLDNGETITLSNALYMDATLVFAGGSEMDLETLVGNQLTGALSLQLGNNGGKLYGGAGADSLYGGSGNDTLNGALGADKLYGYAGNDVLNGGDGDDILDGGDGDDTLIGGAGRDLLLGGSGDDSYQLTSVAGGDKIADTQGQNLIKFGSDIDLNQLTASVSTLAGQAALTLTLAGVELATITQGYSSFGFEFADGTRLTTDDFLLSYRTGSGTGNIVGTNNDDTLFGGQTADKLYGYAGNDTLWGGRGDDELEGGLGSDDYRY